VLPGGFVGVGREYVLEGYPKRPEGVGDGVHS
jgi:hypothetical protein